MIRSPLMAGIWALAVMAASTSIAHGQTTYTWNGGGGNGNWNTAANWSASAGSPPPVSDLTNTLIVLQGATQPTTVVDMGGGTFNINSLSFSGTANFAVNAAGTVTTLQIGTGGITSTSTSSLTIANPLALGASQVWANNNTGAFTASGTVNLGANALTVGGTGTGNATISGIVSGAGGSLTVAKAGTSTLTINAANTFTGATTVTSGILSTSLLANGGTASGIGQSTNAAGNLVLNGGTLRYTGAAVSTDRLFTLTQNGGTLEANGTGAVTFANAGAMAFSGSGARTLTLAGTSNANNILAAIIGNSGGDATSIVKNGASNWVLSATNTYTGGTTINAGGLQFNSAGAIGGAGANVLVNTGGAAAAGYAIDQAFLGRINTSSTGSVALGGVNSANALDFNAAGLTSVSLGAVGAATYTGTLTPTGGTYRLGGGSGTLTMTNVLPDVGGLTNLNVIGTTGTIALNGANTFTGVTTINSGALAVATLANGGAASGLGQSSNAASNLVILGGTLRYTGAGNTTDRLLTLGTGGSAGSLDASGAGAIAFANTGPIAFSGSANRTLNFTGTNIGSFAGGTNIFAPLIANGPGGTTSVTKTGTGTWALTGANTYTGGTTISAGSLAINRPTAGTTPLGTGTITLAGGTLSFRGTNANPLTVTGFNQDVISSFTDIQSANPFGTSFAVDAGGTGGWVLMENHPAFLAAYSLPTTLGLPAGGQINSAANPLTRYQMASYGANGIVSNNSLMLTTDTTNTGSLNIAAGSQGQFQTVSVLLTSGGGASTFTAVLRFSDSTTSTVTGLIAPDWFNNTPFAITNLGRMDRFDGDPDLGATTNPRLYPVDIQLSAADQGKTLVGIDFTRTAGARLNIFGISGAAPAASPASYTNPITVTASSTIELLNSGSVTLGPLSIGTFTLGMNGPANTSVSLGGVTLTGNPTFNVGNTANQSLNNLFLPGAINFNSAARTITKTGLGTLTLDTAATNSTATNTLVANAGVVNVTNATALGTTNLTVGGATVNFGPYTSLNNLTVSSGTAHLTSVATLTGTATISGGTTNFTPAVSIPTANISGGTTNFAGAATITTATISGGTTNFNGAGSALGVATVNGGTVNVNTATSAGRLLGGGGTVALNNSSVLTFGSANTNESTTSVFTGNGSLLKLGTGTQTIQSAASTYSGGTNISAGKVTATRPGALGTGTVTLQDNTTLSIGAPTVVTSTTGFGGTGTGWNLQGTGGPPTVAADVLTITTATGSLARTAWLNDQMPTGPFTASFRYSNLSPTGPADGIAFVLQNASATAIGAAGGGLGYTGINPSAALGVNIFGTAGLRTYLNSAQVLGNTTTGSVNLVNSGAGNEVTFNLVYDGTNLNVTLTQGANTFTLPAQALSLAGLGSSAWIGFTGGTGGSVAQQLISNFSFNFTGTPPAPNTTYANAVVLPSGSSATINTQVTAAVNTLSMGALAMGTGATLNIQPEAGSLANSAYTLNLGATTISTTATFNVANNGSGTGTLVLGALNDGGINPGTINKTGAGTLTLGSAATILVNGAALNVNEGTVRVNNATALGTLTNTTVASGANLSLGAAQTLGALNGAGNVALNGNTLTVGSTNNLSSAFSGVIANGTGAGGLTKAGTGAMFLTGANTYTGPTAVNGGSLLVNGSLANSAVTVGTGATLGGNGSIGGTVALNAGATLSPGASVGTLTVANSVTMNGGTGSSWIVEFNGAPSPSNPNDVLALTGATSNLNLVLSAANKLLISIRTADGFVPAQGSPLSYTIATKDAGGAFQLNGGAYAYDPAHYTFETVGFDATGFALAVSGNSLVLTFTPVPEPGMIIALSAVVLGLLVGVRRRLQKPTAALAA